MKGFFRKIIIEILTLEARVLLSRFKPKILMVTGSVGKTSTKDAIYTALQNFAKVRKSQKSFNSEIGVPLAILGLENAWGNPLKWLLNITVGLLRALFANKYPQWLILEVGADKPGDLTKITKWLKPDAVVVTRFPNVPPHLEFYSSLEKLIEEESAPVFALKSEGILVLNGDDEKVSSLAESFRGKSITYGLTPRSDVTARSEEIIYEFRNVRNVPIGMRFSVLFEDNKIPFEIYNCLGIQHIYPILAAVATALSLKDKFDIEPTLEKLRQAFDDHLAPLGRMRIIEGIKGTIIIDDSYNSSPVAADLALRTLKELKVAGRRVAVLGDMRELGNFSKAEHQKIGTLAAKVCDILLTVGPLARGIAEGALDTLMDEKNIYQFEQSPDAGKFLEGIIREGDTILIKGSQSIRLEKAVEEVMMHPENKEKHLVRQDRDWIRRK